TVRQVLLSWGPGKFDAELLLDGKALRPDGKSGATLLPAAFGLGGVNLHTYTGWGSVPYWNAFVANLDMHGQGRFFDPRRSNTNPSLMPAGLGWGNLAAGTALVPGNLPALQLSHPALPIPEPPSGSFDSVAAARGKSLFLGKASCATCHTPPL